MPTLTRRWIIAVATALYLYFLLPATADMFFALYHLTHLGPIYWGYSGFKAAGYYFGIYEYRLLVCLLLAVAIIVIPSLFKKLRRA
jgi:glycerol-3-phosphate acyltransferase PlsY